jgi:2-polyprenyl-3-methyl-5-hydroxy-6-metoxy-1,4-benzoquinol methylase
MLKNSLSRNEISQPIYNSENQKSITSLGQIYDGATVVYLDETIGHLQTQEIASIETYYDEQYKIFDQSKEDDILYTVRDGKKIFRQEHQLNTLTAKITMKEGLKILDYGCAKGTVMKRLLKQNPSVKVYLYDVSRMYEHLWEQFIPESQYCSYQVKSEWETTFDVVTSFFSFEHVVNPLKELEDIKKLLKKDGLLYLLVPNILENTGDFIVVDHIHHYSESSLHYLLAKAGFETVEIDDKSHFASFIVIAKKTSYATIDYLPDRQQLDHINQAYRNIANYWQNLQKIIVTFEANHTPCRSAIYGAGVYGNFIASSLKNLELIEYFIDQNPLLQNTSVFGIKVISPDSLPQEIDTIYVGLNPKIARQVIDDVFPKQPQHREFLFL